MNPIAIHGINAIYSDHKGLECYFDEVNDVEKAQLNEYMVHIICKFDAGELDIKRSLDLDIERIEKFEDDHRSSSVRWVC